MGILMLNPLWFLADNELFRRSWQIGYFVARREIKRCLKTIVSGLYCFPGQKDIKSWVERKSAYIYQLLNKNTIFQ